MPENYKIDKGLITDICLSSTVKVKVIKDLLKPVRADVYKRQGYNNVENFALKAIKRLFHYFQTYV